MTDLGTYTLHGLLRLAKASSLISLECNTNPSTFPLFLPANAISFDNKNINTENIHGKGFKGSFASYTNLFSRPSTLSVQSASNRTLAQCEFLQTPPPSKHDFP